MKKTLLLIFLILIYSCGKEEEPITIPETVKIIETVTVEVTKVVEKEKIVYLDATYNPEPTWTPTPVPLSMPTWTPTPVPLSVPTWTPTPTPIADATWTPTPTPKPAATWTPTPTPTPLPPGDLGYELVRHTFTVNLTDLGQVTTVGVPAYMSPIVDSNRNDDLLDEIAIKTDPQNYTILKVSQNRNSISEITFVSITPTGNTTISFDFYTTKK
tara:strand:+ start:416 stop:1057 length:642 start_codon:yes stop_codon:yes gene_type:complete